MFQHFPKRWAVADDIFKAVLRADFRFEMGRLVSESPQFDKACSCEISDVSESRAPHSLLLKVDSS
jgi:hypothetical protein